MLSQIKLYVMGGLAALATIFFALWKTTAAGRERDKLAAERKKRDIEKLGNEAAYIGLKRQQEIRDEDINTSTRDHFS